MMEICHEGMSMVKCTTQIINVWDEANWMDRLQCDWVFSTGDKTHILCLGNMDLGW